MEVLQMPVTLIVKAPNQKIQDQTVECELSWTIEKLKGYLSEVYPSKPRTEDQKLIYSGQLLPNHLKLKDILRQYENRTTHTVHLVCAPTRDFMWSAPSQNSKTAFSGDSNQVLQTANVDSVNMNDNHQNFNENIGLRHRLNVSGQNTSFNSYFPGYVSAGQQINTEFSREQIMQQMMAMQQMYAQYMQYMQMGQFQQEIPEGFVSPQQAVGLQTSPAVAHQEDPITPPPAAAAAPNQDVVPPAAPANEEVRMNAQGGAFMEEEDDEVRGNRDWLDWVYILSRLLVLFSIVYFYSSLVRFLLVAGLGMLLYLYQIGFFHLQRRLSGNNNENQQNAEADNNVNNNENHPEEVPSPVNDTTTTTQSENQPTETDSPTTEETTGISPENVNAEPSQQDTSDSTSVQEQGPSFLTITWTFFSSFISSMIPEQPTVN